MNLTLLLMKRDLMEKWGGLNNHQVFLALIIPANFDNNLFIF